MGLTANQMTRKSDGVDRQKSSFFWPDETDTVPKMYRKPASRNGTPQNTTVSSPAATPEREIRPKELFHKQLTSKIEFCDDIQKSPLPSKRNSAAYRSTPKDSPAKQLINNSTPNESLPKPNTFVSKIEFYDYDEIPSVVKSTPNVKRYEEDNLKSQKSPNSPKNTPTDRKKITFDDRSVKKSILKNNEVKPTMNVEHNSIAIDRMPQFKKNIVPKRNLSKSVENVSKLDISSDHSPVRNNSSSNTPAAAKELYKVNGKEPHSKMEYRQEQEEHYSTSSNSHNNYEEPSKVVQKSRKTVRNDYNYQDNHGTNNSYTHEETYNDWSDQNGHNQRSSDYQRQSPNNRTDNRRYSNQHEVYQGYRNSPNTTKSPHHLPRDEYDDYSSPRSAGRRNTPKPAHDDNSRREESRWSNQRSDGKHYNSKQYESPVGLVIPQYPNEASIRAHSHLRSNIFFNDSSYEEDRPRSVRESAVARVGVGLPNI